MKGMINFKTPKIGVGMVIMCVFVSIYIVKYLVVSRENNQINHRLSPHTGAHIRDV